MREENPSIDGRYLANVTLPPDSYVLKMLYKMCDDIIIISFQYLGIHLQFLLHSEELWIQYNQNTFRPNRSRGNL